MLIMSAKSVLIVLYPLSAIRENRFSANFRNKYTSCQTNDCGKDCNLFVKKWKIANNASYKQMQPAFVE